MNEQINVLLVDDEKPVRSALRELLQSHFSNIVIVGEAASIPEAVREINQHKPQLVFLDIEMPGYSGLQLIDFFNPGEIKFDIIFVTAFNEYAIQAFKVAAFDYLLKPVNRQDLAQTLERYTNSYHHHRVIDRVNLLKESYTKEEAPSQLAVSSANGIDFIKLDDVILFEASGSYTRIVMTGADFAITASKPLGEFETVLQHNKQFFRAHRSYLINLGYVKKLLSKEGDMILMQNDVQVPLSRYRRKDLDKAIASFRI